MPPQIVETYATGAEIDAIMEQRLLPAIHDLERSKVMMALITLLLCLQKPEISSEEAREGVKQVSQFVCMFLSSPDLPAVGDTSEDARKKMN